MGFKGLGDLRVQSLPRAAQHTAMRCILHQRVLEAVDCVGRHAALEDQLGSDEASESRLQLILGNTGYSAQQFVGKLPPDCRADLRDLPL